MLYRAKVTVCSETNIKTHKYSVGRNVWMLNMLVDCSWNVMAHGDAREGKWRGNWRMQWVASTLCTTSEHGLSSITTADVQTSAASSRLNWRPRRLKWTRPFRAEDEIWFLRVCRHISTGLYIKQRLGFKRLTRYITNTMRVFIHVHNHSWQHFSSGKYLASYAGDARMYAILPSVMFTLFF